MENKKYIVWLTTDGCLSNKEYTPYEYKIGEVITVNSNDKYKCIEKSFINEELIQIFKQGEITINFDW